MSREDAGRLVARDLNRNSRRQLWIAILDAADRDERVLLARLAFDAMPEADRRVLVAELIEEATGKSPRRSVEFADRGCCGVIRVDSSDPEAA